MFRCGVLSHLLGRGWKTFPPPPSAYRVKIGTNLKINLDGERAKIKDKPDVKFNKKRKQDIKPNTGFNKDHKRDIKPKTGSKREHKQDTKPHIEFKRDVIKPDTITYEDEKVALVLGITSVFTVWWIFR